MLSEQTAGHLIEVAADIIRNSPEAFHDVLAEFPVPIYSIDDVGTLTHFNNACVDLAGRTPTVGTDKWCVTWKIYTTDGDFLPHDACPMAVAMHERRRIRGVEAIAERPDGTRRNFMPFPTPVFGKDGSLTGAVNLLLDITGKRRPTYPPIARSRTRLAELRMADLEALARMAARIAGKDPDDHVTIKFGDEVAFDDVVWRYPDFHWRAEAAYRLLNSVDLSE